MRNTILKDLEQTPGRHLVLVRYMRHDRTVEGWVSNQAQIDSSRVVWALDMGAAKNEELLRYYVGRRVWLVHPDDQSPKALPYGEVP